MSIFSLALAALALLLAFSYIRLNPPLLSPSPPLYSAPLHSRRDWFIDPPPSPCLPILSNPTPPNSLCYMLPHDVGCTRNSTTMFSQYKQDYYLYTHHFRHLSRLGTYIDIGTYEPVDISNTYFMDRCLGWGGICVEVQPDYHHKIYDQRSCMLVPTCLASRAGTVEVILNGGWTGINDASYKHRSVSTENVAMLNVTCTTMKTVLERFKLHHVDYITLDVEGHEMDVLLGFDWDNVIVNVFTIEVSPQNLPDIQRYLEAKGYIRHFPTLDDQSTRTGLLGEDALFLHRDVVFGKPV